ncbi:copper homeostasis protein CutC [Virgibacillus chiguensis]|uniref:copper homeostasis protein CutC n=1 Tax=Virgibacillus chiguensis TaxID=411959 RepID=UPI0024528987|nr:copper homeostasis protein CutC [Virgibacillus chiguensis]
MRSIQFNEQMLHNLIERFPGLDITFYRAFNEVKDMQAAYKTLVKYKDNVKRILTSVGK